MADRFTRETNQIVTGHGSGAQIQYLTWPAPTGVPAAGVAVVSGAGAWGNVADICAVGWIAVEYWVCGFTFNIIGGGAVQVMEIIISSTGPAAGAGGPVTAPFLFQVRFDPTAITTNLPPFMLPYPVYRPAGTRVCYCAGGAAARSAAVSLIYATALA